MYEATFMVFGFKILGVTLRLIFVFNFNYSVSKYQLNCKNIA
jgi:hypothetical protein